MADLDGLGSAFSEPFADASALPTLALCRMASRHVKVALSGDGGDELFAGYRRYPHHLAEERVKARLPGWMAQGVFGPLASAYPALHRAPRVLRAKSTFESLATDAMGGLFRATAIMQESPRDRLLGQAARIDAYSTADLLRDHAAEAQTDDPLARAQYVDLMTWLPGRMLVKVDRASMASGIEVRNPLLDIDLAQWAARLPTAMKLDGFSGKRVLKSALRQHVPDTILDAKKRGFVAPIGAWMTGRYADRMDRLTDHSMLIESGLINRDALRGLWHDQRSGRADNSRALWTMLMLDRFVARIDDPARLDHAA
jgi:asparagine synthase (glutamine-hydrolysing)